MTKMNITLPLRKTLNTIRLAGTQVSFKPNGRNRLILLKNSLRKFELV
jgi:hypothetical protein